MANLREILSYNRNRNHYFYVKWVSLANRLFEALVAGYWMFFDYVTTNFVLDSNG